MSRILHTWLALVLILIGANQCRMPTSEIKLHTLRIEYLENPIGLDIEKPRLSWQMMSEKRNQGQVAYQILVSSDSHLLHSDSGDIWNSGMVISSESHQIEYRGLPLQSREECFWKVRVWDQDSIVSGWSGIAHWTMGLLSTTDWSAHWIGYDEAWMDSTIKAKPWANGMHGTSEYKPLPSPYLRKEFVAEKSVIKAKAYVTALGIYELHINGIRVGEEYFSPGWTEYRKRIYYKTYDVSDYLIEGENAIGVILADGWYAGNVANRGQYYYGKKLRLKVQLELTYNDGTNEIIVSDDSWRASYGPIREADMQGGETYDARLECKGWNEAGFDDLAWNPVVVSDTSTAELQAYPSIGVRKTQEITPIEITKMAAGNFIVDMGQNFSGWVKLSMKGVRGDSIVIRYGEKRMENGKLYTRNLRTARATDTYIIASDSTETWEPRFTYHGFQFAEISGYSGELTTDDVVGIVVHTDLERSGSFSCSNPLVNQLYSNIMWSQRSNYFDVPTDCPQRDERMGWTGDAQIFMPTAAYNMNVAPFFTKWLVDVADGQYEDGRFPSTAPLVYKRVAAGWGDAGILCPWTMYQWYDDKQILERLYPNMIRWIDHIEGRSPNYLSTLGSYGDWQNVESETPVNVIATAYFKHSVDVMISIAKVLENEEDEIRFSQLSQHIKKAFIDSFLQDSARLPGNTQTAYLMALEYDLVPEGMIDRVVKNLLQCIYVSDTSLTTGILGTKLLLPILSKYGHTDLAFRLLLNEQYPSWGHQINNGATTIWERWNSYSKFQGFHEDSTNSLNHYAYGSVGEWFYSTIGGIRSLEPGFKKILIRPQPGGGLTYAHTDYRTRYGLVSSHWKFEDDQFILEVEVPVNTTATVVLPASVIDSVFESGLPIQTRFETNSLGGEVKIEVGSGKYVFEVRN